MIKEHIIQTVEKERGETQKHIDICENCQLPVSECNGECDYFKKQAKRIRQNKKIKKNIIVF